MPELKTKYEREKIWKNRRYKKQAKLYQVSHEIHNLV